MDLTHWLNVRINSENTREVYGRWMKQFLEFHDVEDEDTVDWSDETARDAVLDFVSHLQNRDLLTSGEGGLAPASIQQAWWAVNSWFSANHIDVGKSPEFRGGRTYYDHIPSKTELAQMLSINYGWEPLVYRLGMSLMSFSGMRPVDVLNLRWDDIVASYTREDEILTIKCKQQKTGERYITFLSPQGVAYLDTLLDKRRAEGERFESDSYVVSRDGSKTPRTSWDDAMRAIIKGTIGKHPTGESFKRMRAYSLRKYFNRQANTKLNYHEVEYMMGHSAGIRGLAGTYSGLRDLDPIAITQLKEKYKQAIPQLEPWPSKYSVRPEMRDKLHALKGILSDELGLDESEIDQRIRTKIESMGGGFGGGKSIKAEWDADLILSRLITALSEE